MADAFASSSAVPQPARCPAAQVFDLIGPKWTMSILHTLHIAAQPVRFRLLQRTVGTITAKELTKRLRELERAGLLTRTIYPEVPPRVEYDLTELGRTMIPALDGLHQWAVAHGATVEANRRQFDQSHPPRAESVA